MRETWTIVAENSMYILFTVVVDGVSVINSVRRELEPREPFLHFWRGCVRD